MPHKSLSNQLKPNVHLSPDLEYSKLYLSASIGSSLIVFIKNFVDERTSNSLNKVLKAYTKHVSTVDAHGARLNALRYRIVQELKQVFLATETYRTC